MDAWKCVDLSRVGLLAGRHWRCLLLKTGSDSSTMQRDVLCGRTACCSPSCSCMLYLPAVAQHEQHSRSAPPELCDAPPIGKCFSCRLGAVCVVFHLFPSPNHHHHTHPNSTASRPVSTELVSQLHLNRTASMTGTPPVLSPTAQQPQSTSTTPHSTPQRRSLNEPSRSLPTVPHPPSSLRSFATAPGHHRTTDAVASRCPNKQPQEEACRADRTQHADGG
ncbi:hypothetical protein HDK77DRAFT_232243 [Phyllosticta capitalensis]|uniref:Uncharacterized protein n=1 Tax=Phyllosticta capitalensis TaxID=121624 RepID=A0ABR1YNN9_9PEZI